MAKRLERAGLFLLVLSALPHPIIAASKASIATAATATEVFASEESDANTDQKLLLDVQINGRSIGKIGEFTLRRGRLMARPEELRDLGFRISVSRTLGLNELIELSELRGVTWRMDRTNMILHITADNSALIPTLLQIGGKEEQEGPRQIESGTGITLNDNLVGTFTSSANGASGSADLRIFSPLGIVSLDWLGYMGATSGGSGKNTAIRLDSTYTLADVNTLRRYSLGDFTTGGLSWNRAVHLEGAQMRSDFTMRPDLITFPLPSLAGSAAVPTTVDVLVNGNLVTSNQVDAGPFEIPQLPVISGAGTITMRMTNAQGQQVSVTQPFYGGSTLLAPGLQTFAVQTGLVRREWGATSNNFGKMAATGFYRRGLTRKLTIEGTAEITSGVTMGGVGAAMLAGNLAMVTFDVAASGGAGRFGELLSVGAQHVGTTLSLGGSAILANRHYRDVAAMNGSGVLRKQISGFAGLSLRHFGSAGVAYAGINEDASPVSLRGSGTQSESSHIVTANYSTQIHHVSLYASEFKSLDSNGSNGFQIGMTIPLGKRSSASISGSSSGSGQAQVQQSVARVGDWGYQAYVSAGGGTREFAEAQYKSPVGLFTAGVDQSFGQTTVRLESQGALSFVDHGLFPSNTVYDSFAIVDTAPLKHVRVYEENRNIGTTSKKGKLLVPDMRAFDANHLGIEPTDVPADASLGFDKKIVRPQDRSGVVVKFPIQFSHAALLRLVDAHGVALPLGSAATLRATGALVSVGYDGEAYIENLSSRNELTVLRPDGRYCAVTFSYKSVAGDIPSIGPLRCLEKTK